MGIGLGLDEEDGGLPHELVGLAAELVGYAGDDPAEATDALLEARSAARAAKDWGKADSIRDGIAALGLVIEDTAAGPRVHKGE